MAIKLVGVKQNNEELFKDFIKTFEFYGLLFSLLHFVVLSICKQRHIETNYTLLCDLIRNFTEALLNKSEYCTVSRNWHWMIKF